MAQHPYFGLPKRQFWKSAVETVPTNLIADLASPKNLIGPTDAVATAGSCFAQHIARNLRQRGFNFLDVEPPPSILKRERQASFGFGLYSARYGNVYTAAQLRQLVERAARRFKSQETAWRRADRFFDPFRPTVEPDGFESEEAMLVDQQAHLRKVLSLFRAMDVFVFTLGLTEMWRAKADGSVFPRAPGVDGVGEFDPALYEFANATYDETRADLLRSFAILRKIKPGIRVILTVSPVPLAATAASEHVLTATTYSKSVLRSVAGELASRLEYVDYFPSYELVTAPVFRGHAYQDDWREVRPEAVERVMEQFFLSFVSGMPRPPIQPRLVGEFTEEDVLCDEAILRNYADA